MKPDGIHRIPTRFVYTGTFLGPLHPSHLPAMNDLLSMMARHGYALTFVVLLAEAMGFPFPAAIALVAAGAATASHTLSGTGVVATAMIALMIGDIAPRLCSDFRRAVGGSNGISLPGSTTK